MLSYYTFPSRKLVSKSILIGLMTLLAQVLVHGQTTWTGGDGSFTDASNWSSGAPIATNGGTISTTGTLNIGLSVSDTIGALLTTGSGTINLSVVSNLLTINGASSPAFSIDNGSTLTLTGTAGGGITVQSGQLAIGDSSGNSGTLNLNGGTLAVGGTNGIVAGTGTAVINGGGGTIQVINSSLTTGIALTLATNTRTMIDTNGFDATFGSINNTSDTNGGLTKIGAGTLYLTGSSNSVASLYSTGGNISQSTGTFTISEFGLGYLSGNTASYTITGGTLILTAGAPPPIVGASASSIRIGDFGGTGTFTQSGGLVQIDGSLNIGNQGGHGTYILSGGLLDIRSAFSTLGRTSGGTASSAGSTGEFDISGSGTLSIDGTAAFVASNWYPNTLTVQGTGTINQSGGTIIVANTAALILTGTGTGTYNFTGGVLQIGGSTSLQGVYFGQNGTYAFNLGGGTIQVSGSDLVTSVNATLAGSSTSTVNTNGFNATLSGSFSGTGHLVKSGTGSLLLTGGNSYNGGTTVSAGALIVNNTAGSATGSGTLVVASGATLGGTGSVAPSSFNISGNLQVGDGVHHTGSFTLSNTGSSTFTAATLQFNLGSTAGQSSELKVGTAAIDFSNSTISLIFNTYPPADSLFTLIDNGTGTDTYTGLTLSGTDTNGYSIITGGLTLSNNNGSYLYLDGGVIGVSESSVVPEPGTWALLLCGLATLLCWERKRRLSSPTR